MRSLLNSVYILILLLAGGLATAQTKPTPTPATVPAKPAAQLGTHATADLPSEATVDAFLHQQFGYQPDLSWKISGIRAFSHPRISGGHRRPGELRKASS